MTFKKLLDINIESKEMYKQLKNDYYDCDTILLMQANIDMGFGDTEFELNVAHLRMAKEIELKERYGIPIYKDAPIELFHLSLAEKLNLPEGMIV